MLEYQGHSLLGLRAAEGLPQWEIDLLNPDMSEKEIGQAIMPPIHTVREKLGAYCLILDWIYQEEYAHYCRLENGKWIPHGPVKGASGGISESGNLSMIQQLLQAMIDELKASSWEEAVRRAGALGHFLQEPFTPGHSTDNRMIQEFFPDPNPQRHWRLHHCFDSASGDYPPPEPRLMGTTPEEAAFRIFDCIKKGIVSGRAMIAPVVDAAYRGSTLLENRKIFQALLCKQSQKAAYITACAWHTAFCIAFDRFEEEEKMACQTCDLSTLTPYYMHPSHYVHITPGHLVSSDGWLMDLDVWDEKKNSIRFEKGIGIYGHSGYKYFVNGLFSRFRFKLGMPSRKLAGQDEHTLLHFTIETDDKENTLYSEDIEYEASARPLEVTLHAFEPVREYCVDIRGAKTLIISSRCTPYINDQGVTVYSCPDLAILDPELIR